MTKAKYVDGYVLIVPKKGVAAYKKMAKEGAKAWMKFGALNYKECMGEDITKMKKEFMGTAFPKLMSAKKGDTVWFSYIEFKSRKHRDMVNKKVMAYFADKYKDMDYADMPMDPRRMSYGGFSVEVSG